MNLSTAVFLINDSVRSVRVSYEPGFPGNHGQLFKTLDPSITKDDIIVVPTDTRHKMTCVKVEEVDFGVDFDSSTNYRWVIGKVDITTYESVLEQEKKAMSRVQKADENDRRAKLKAALKMDTISFTDLDIAGPSPALPAPATVRGAPPAYASPPHEAPSLHRPKPYKGGGHPDDDIDGDICDDIEF